MASPSFERCTFRRLLAARLAIVFFVGLAPLDALGAEVAGTRASTRAVRTFAGGSDFHGELSRESARPTVAFGARYSARAEAEDRLRFGIGFDVVSLDVHQQGDAFPYEKGRELEILAFLLLPHACGDVGASMDLCAGIGLGTVNVNAPGDRQDYGTWHYELSLRAPLSDMWTVEAVVKDIGKVEQEVAERDAAFWLVAYGVGVAATVH